MLKYCSVAAILAYKNGEKDTLDFSKSSVSLLLQRLLSHHLSTFPRWGFILLCILQWLLLPQHTSFFYRYVVIKKLGWGHFSTVWMVKDRKVKVNLAGLGTRGKPNLRDSTEGMDDVQHFFALKVQKSAEHYTEAAMDEVELLDCVSAERRRCEAALLGSHLAIAGDPDGVPNHVVVDHSKHVAALHNSFFHTGPNGRHMCMVFSMLGCNLLSVIKAYNYRGIPIPAVKKMIRGIAKGLDFLHRRCEIIHTDLKPENVLLQFPPQNINPATYMDDDVSTISESNATIQDGMTIEEMEAAIQNPKISTEERKRLRKRLKKKRQKEKRRQQHGQDQEEDGGVVPGTDGQSNNDAAETTGPPMSNPMQVGSHGGSGGVGMNLGNGMSGSIALSDAEMERILNERQASGMDKKGGNQARGAVGGGQNITSPDAPLSPPNAHKSVLSRLTSSPFMVRNFASRQSLADSTDLSVAMHDAVQASQPGGSELAAHLRMHGGHLERGGGVAEVTFLIRAFVPEGEIADNVSAALGGIPWDRSDDKGITREW